jgi:polyphosphate kinase 2 (PPK2 family)
MNDDSLWRDRYRSIVNLEKHLHRNGTRIVKFFLHLSKEEQRKRFLKRIDDPEKSWKFNPGDVAERKYWAEYIRAYEDCLGATSTQNAPWHIVPADDKADARLIVSRIILDAFEDMKLKYPKITPARLREMESIRRQLAG